MMRPHAGHILISLVLAGAETALAQQCPAASRDSLPTDSLLKCWAISDSLAIEESRSQMRTMGGSYVILSLIKSVAGQIPKAEFFDLRLRFSGLGGRESERWFTSANLDIALSQSEADTSTNQRLTDASILEWVTPFLPKKRLVLEERKGPGAKAVAVPIYRRISSFGGGAKVFNTVPYLLLGVSGWELRGSPLEGSFIAVAWAHRLVGNRAVPPGSDTTDVTRARALDNLYAEFYVRVPGVQFLDKLRIRGGVLLPFKDGFDIETRIVLSVPIVDLQRF